MSKVGQWVFEMQEDAYHLTLSQFIDKHGFSQAEVWYTINFGEDIEPDFEPEPLEMDDGS
jgi:hypothetical protein